MFVHPNKSIAGLAMNQHTKSFSKICRYINHRHGHCRRYISFHVGNYQEENMTYLSYRFQLYLINIEIFIY